MAISADSEIGIQNLINSGYAIDEIASMTGVPGEQIAMMVGDRSMYMPPEPPMGLSSILPQEDTTELDMLVDQGNSITDIVAPDLGIEIEPKLYLDEALTMDTMEKFGVDAEEDEAMLEEENDPLKKVIMASAAGASALGEDDPDAQDTLSVMNNISGAFEPDDPEDMKKQFEVYKKAGEIFFDVEDLKEMVPEPDKALPWLVAGASLVQSGEAGDSWGTALSKAFTQYAGADYKERKEYEKTLSSLDIQRKQNINKFAMDMVVSDINTKKQLANQLLTADRQFFTVDGTPNLLTDYEANLYEEMGYTVLPYDKEDGKLKEFTLFEDKDGDGQPDGDSAGVTYLMSDTEAKNKQGKGFVVREGNLLKDKKFYSVNGVYGMYGDERIATLVNEGADVRQVPANSIKQARDKLTGNVVFIDSAELRTPEGRERYVPITDAPRIIMHNGEPILIEGEGAGGILTERDISKESIRIGEFLRDNDTKRNNVLTVYGQITNIIDTAKAQGEDIKFGMAGNLTVLGKNVLDQIDQFQDLLTGYSYYEDKNNNGRRDPDEVARDIPGNFGNIADSFEERFANTNTSVFWKNTGLGRKRINNLILSLALQSAALDGQTGRDISDKDIERFLTRAGAYATSEEEFLQVLDDLALQTIEKSENQLTIDMRYAPAFANPDYNPDNPGDEPERINLYELNYPNAMELSLDSRPFSDAPYTVRELKERLKNQSVRRTPLDDRRFDPGQGVAILPGGNELSGDGNKTVHDIYMDYISFNAPDGAGFDYLVDLKEKLGPTSAEWKAIAKYINEQGRQ